MLPEPLQTIAFLVLVPIIVEALKFGAEKIGTPIPTVAISKSPPNTISPKSTDVALM